MAPRLAEQVRPRVFNGSRIILCTIASTGRLLREARVRLDALSMLASQRWLDSLTDEDMVAVFSNIEEILELHNRRVLPRLTSRMRNWDHKQGAGDCCLFHGVRCMIVLFIK